MKLLPLVHAGATLFMVGVIWFVQVVHYPLFARVGAGGFAAYEAAHGRRTSWVVVPAMLCELLSAAMLAWSPPDGVVPALPLAGLAALGLIWLSTFVLQVPAHRALGRGFDRGAPSGWWRPTGSAGPPGPPAAS